MYRCLRNKQTQSMSGSWIYTNDVSLRHFSVVWVHRV